MKFLVALILFLSLNASVNAQAVGKSPAFDPTIPAKAADAAVQIYERITGVKLTYTPESLRSVDEFVIALSNENKDPKKYENLLNFLGFYVGEVMARNKNLAWFAPTAEELRLGLPSYALRHSNGRAVNPIGKVYRLFQNGAEDSTYGLYVALDQLLTAPLN